jgi:hypothetical protein
VEGKSHIFRRVFRGREDIVPRYWTSKDGQRHGYTPLCKNQWKGELCQKPCRTCPNADYIPLSDSLILDHFKGHHILGVYPLLKDGTCHFVACDFDNHNGDRSPLEDTRAFYEVREVQEIPCYVLRSKSGRGYHAYIFFDSPAPAWKARIVIFALLQEAQVIGDDIELSSFDRLFPNQDQLTGKGFGNLIALPFQGEAAKRSHTLFLDPKTSFTEAFKDQWGILTNIRRVPEAKLNELIQEWNLKPRHSQTIRGPRYYSNDASEIIEHLMQCDFVKWCKEAPAKVPEPLWYALISNLIRLRGGYSLAHELSRPYPGYTRQETDAKIHQAMDRTHPMTCYYIRQNGFKCKRFCGIRAPIGLIYMHKNHHTKEGPREWIPYEEQGQQIGR